jgi:molybdopterin-containing oxidoreductase family iron-sulfur binding subunit
MTDVGAPAALDFSDIRQRLAGKEGVTYWRSLDELADTYEFQEYLRKEFPRQAAPLENGVDRRDFLKLLGASMALAGLSACARPPLSHEKIVPYVRQDDEITPGKPLFYATAVTYGGYAEGVLAESHQGRPTKLEGNPDHPASRGATGAVTQGQVLNLYDPDRSQVVMNGEEESDWEAFTAALTAALSGAQGGAGVALLTEHVTSPTLASQLAQFQTAFPQARWYQYDTLHPDNAVAGARLAFGADVDVVYDLSAADVIVSLDADFLDEGPGRLAHARAFADRRRVLAASDTMNRLYQLETSPSATGTLADLRVALKPSSVAGAAAAIAAAFGVAGAAGALPDGLSQERFDALVEDLREAGSAGLVIAGASQPPTVHALAAAINQALGSVGTTVRYVDSVSARPAVHIAELAELTAALRAGDVNALIIIGANPVYTAPADLEFATALEQAPFTAHLGLYRDETGLLCDWHVPQTHFLETWSDARAFDGTTTITQPLILPFYGGKSEHELLAAVLGTPDAAGYDIVRGYWQGRVSGSFEDFWRETVYRGVVANSAAAAASVTLTSFAVELPAPSETEVLFVNDRAVLDGRFANNGWMQELPRPISKLTWDNAALMAPATAEGLRVATGDIVALTHGSRRIDVPVLVQPGQAAGAVTVALGFGRTAAGRIGNAVGVDAYLLRVSDSPAGGAAEVEKTSRTHQLVSTQSHHALEGTGDARFIVRSGSLTEFRAEPEHPHFAHPVAHHSEDLYPDFAYEGYKWGMVIDQTVCTGCNACVVACQSENNVPIVGKAQVAVGREMHWLRVDSYYGGSIDDPQFYAQPMPCQHCEKAPCEPVCPVGATVHDSEGLNVMVYNRCVGTRYCSNNCPYKVRRFNWLQYAELSTTSTELSLANNPDVTIRSRGVMEKCTYCTQRISRARIEAANEDRRIADGEVVTACQSACPTQAIVFGDLNDPTSRVNRVKASPINYTMLEELQTFPRTSYLAKIKNPNPALTSEGVS